MNHTEKPVHTAHKHPFVFVQKTDKFWFVMSCANHSCMVCKSRPHRWTFGLQTVCEQFDLQFRRCVVKRINCIFSILRKTRKTMKENWVDRLGSKWCHWQEYDPRRQLWSFFQNFEPPREGGWNFFMCFVTKWQTKQTYILFQSALTVSTKPQFEKKKNVQWHFGWYIVVVKFLSRWCNVTN